ncbi:hypothetical protein PDJAM_G00231130 [Pangasius djambal]|uniref:Uncharacterized protein n=1 Tax=Pangasius djambal TaxID=1691987 RepID=A0ACC5YFF4_9TELE|nr:hypothetical protein [Pangasius djambal]
MPEFNLALRKWLKNYAAMTHSLFNLLPLNVLAPAAGGAAGLHTLLNVCACAYGVFLCR